MADRQQLDILMQGVDVWNAWRKEQPDKLIDLSQAKLHGAELSGIDLRRANLKEVDLSETHLYKANLFRANLTNANLRAAIVRESDLNNTILHHTQLQQANLASSQLLEASLQGTNLYEADLRFVRLSNADLSSVNMQKANLEGASFWQATLHNVNLSHANLRKTNFLGAKLDSVNLSDATLSQSSFTGAQLKPISLNGVNLRGVQFDGATLDSVDLRGIDLSGANLRHATLDRVKLDQANLTDCLVFRLVVWETSLDGAIQHNLRLTDEYEPVVTIDSLANVHLLSLLLSHDTPPPLVRTLTTNMVVILGFFPSYRMAVLNTIRDELRRQGYTPVLFDRERAASPRPGDESVVERAYPEMLERLVSLAQFVLLDLTEMSLLPKEWQTLMPSATIPFQPLLHARNRQGTTLVPEIERYPHCLPLFIYHDERDLQQGVEERILVAERLGHQQEDQERK